MGFFDPKCISCGTKTKKNLIVNGLCPNCYHILESKFTDQKAALSNLICKINTEKNLNTKENILNDAFQLLEEIESIINKIGIDDPTIETTKQNLNQQKNSLEQLYNKLSLYGNQSKQIFSNCAKIVDKTKNPETGIFNVLLCMFHFERMLYLTDIGFWKPVNIAQIIDLLINKYFTFSIMIIIKNVSKRKLIEIPHLKTYKNMDSSDENPGRLSSEMPKDLLPEINNSLNVQDIEQLSVPELIYIISNKVNPKQNSVPPTLEIKDSTVLFSLERGSFNNGIIKVYESQKFEYFSIFSNGYPIYIRKLNGKRLESVQISRSLYFAFTFTKYFPDNPHTETDVEVLAPDNTPIYNIHLKEGGYPLYRLSESSIYFCIILDDYLSIYKVPEMQLINKFHYRGWESLPLFAPFEMDEQASISNIQISEDNKIVSLQYSNHKGNPYYCYTFAGELLDSEEYDKCEYLSKSGFSLYGKTLTELSEETRPLTKEKGIKYIDLLKDCFTRDFYGSRVASAYRHIGELYLEIDDKLSALEYFRKAVEKNPKIGLKRTITQLEKELVIQ